eukprot:CAMPEP_0172925624 /NCGR_PEP_ID=MMETSP1075-20121228/214078_1 /TAXON_ID=2916 /ORGANISM="Ceratium fusus, Strain PA161109" /LENGTH=120 /DNA_ID=CAMNT_0013786547 /DNA_START=116 /DNA_END=476 /DNA_ORIENTATION=+
MLGVCGASRRPAAASGPRPLRRTLRRADDARMRESKEGLEAALLPGEEPGRYLGAGFAILDPGEVNLDGAPVGVATAAAAASWAPQQQPPHANRCHLHQKAAHPRFDQGLDVLGAVRPQL